MIRFVHRSFLAFALLAVSSMAVASDTKDETSADAADAPATLLTVHVTNTAGRPVPGAEAFLLDGTYGLAQSKNWQRANVDGDIVIATDATEFETEELEGKPKATLIVRAPGHAWVTKSVNVPSTETVGVTLEAGKQVAIVIKSHDGKPLPNELLPIVFSEGLSAAAWSTNVQGRTEEYGAGSTFSAAVAERAGVGRFALHVPSNLEKLWVLVHQPGYLRAFQAEPFESAAIEAGVLEVTLPEPATLTIDIHPAEGKATEYESCGATIMMSPEIPDGGWAFRIYEEFSPAQSLNVSLDDLPPGAMSVNAFTGTKDTRYARDREDYYTAAQWFEIAAGEEKSLDFALETFDEDALRAELKGDHSITIKVTKPDGSPAAGMPYELAFTLRSFGKDITVQEGELPENGEITVEGLPAGGTAPVQLSVNGNSLGWIRIDETKQHSEHAFGVPPAVGEMAPNIKLTRLDNDETFTLSDLRGQVVFLDFWASWCGPCQDPMAHNNDVMKRRTDWQGNAVIIGASIDNEIDTIKDHVGKHEWTNVLQAHCSEGEKGWACDAVKTYAVTGIPACFLIDREGKIAWTGHPASIDVEEKIDELIRKN